MKVTTQLLRSRAGKPLHLCEHIDLSNLGLECVQKLQSCPRLRHLNLRGNNIDYLSNLDCCPQLWKVDLSSNQIHNLEGLQRFVALGTLVLANNDLAWTDLSKIRHMHILELSLHGNQQLEKDPYYRIHVVDSLPNVWVLDGRIITSAETVQVQQFFDDSALTEHPIRHRLSKEKFTPTALQKINVTGVFGEQTEHLMRRFPINGALNVDTDRRRLQYLAYNIEEDLKIEAKHSQRNYSVVSKSKHFLEELLEGRRFDTVTCNMILLLLVSSLEFAIATHLMTEVLTCTKLDKVGESWTMDLFLLPRETRCQIVSLLLSAVKVDRDVGQDGGLYDKLYLCLYHSVSELTRLSQGTTACISSNKQYTLYKESRCLIASEVVQLLCVVPTFFDYLTKDAGTMNLVTVATSTSATMEKVHKLMRKMEKAGFEEKHIYESAAEQLLKAIKQNVQGVLSRKGMRRDQADDFVLKASKAIPKRPQSSPMFSSSFHAQGQISPDRKPMRLKTSKNERRGFVPQARLGEKVLLGPQNLGRIIVIPEPDIVLVQMDTVPADTGAMVKDMKNPEEHYTYIDMNEVYWDHLAGYWRPKGTTGDRITIHVDDDTGPTDILAPPLFGSMRPWSGMSTAQSLQHQHNLLATVQDSAQSKVDVAPKPVSALYKEQHQLKLDLRTATKDELEPLQGLQVVDDLLGGLRPESGRSSTRRPTTAKSAHCSARDTPQSVCYTSLQQDGLYESLKSAMNSVSYSLVHRPAACMPSEAQGGEGAAKQNNESNTAISPTCTNDDEEVLLYRASKPLDSALSSAPPLTQVSLVVHTPPTRSRRSSLASADEPELEDFAANSRPSTALSSKSQPSDKALLDLVIPGSKLETPIEIPQVLQDSTETELGSQRTSRDTLLSGNLPAGPRTSPVPGLRHDKGTSHAHKRPEAHSRAPPTGRLAIERNEVAPIFEAIPTSVPPVKSKANPPLNKKMQYVGSGPRPVGAVDAYKLIINKEPMVYMESMYQTNRTDAWKSGNTPRSYKASSTSTERDGGPPPQRPSSPSPATMETPAKEPPSSSAEPGSRKPVQVKHGSGWLAGGKNVFWENQLTRPRSGHIPGWKEGLPQRPKSAAAVRALKRSKTPNIITPSSLAYDNTYGAGASPYAPGITPAALETHRRPVSAQASYVRSANEPYQWHGFKYESHPASRATYALHTQRPQYQQNAQCEACLVKQEEEETQLRGLLGHGNAELISKLASLEPCCHLSNGTEGSGAHLSSPATARRPGAALTPHRIPSATVRDDPRETLGADDNDDVRDAFENAREVSPPGVHEQNDMVAGNDRLSMKPHKLDPPGAKRVSRENGLPQLGAIQLPALDKLSTPQ